MAEKDLLDEIYDYAAWGYDYVKSKLYPGYGEDTLPQGFNFGQPSRAWPGQASIQILNLKHNWAVPMASRHLFERSGTASRGKLIVSGTVSGSQATVSVNGAQVAVKGGKWAAKLPVDRTGSYPVIAQAGGNYHAVRVYLVDVVVPLEECTDDRVSESPLAFAIAADPPRMPRLRFRARLAGHPDRDLPDEVAYTWELTIGGCYRIRTEGRSDGRWVPYAEAFRGITEGDQRWTPQLDTFYGGWARLTVKARVPYSGGAYDVEGGPYWFEIWGTNPGEDALREYLESRLAHHLGDRAEAHLEIARCILKQESAFVQFREKPDRRERRDERAGSLKTPGKWRPLYGAPPAGIGLGQIDPAAWPARRGAANAHWNWHDNVDAAVKKYRANLDGAERLAGTERSRLETERKLALKIPGIGQNVDALPVVPDLTDEQVKRETIRRYNGNRQYRFDARYVYDRAANRVVLRTVGGSARSGDFVWVSGSGHWESTRRWTGAKQGGLQVRPRGWIENTANPDYVDKACKCSGTCGSPSPESEGPQA